MEETVNNGRLKEIGASKMELMLTGYQKYINNIMNLVRKYLKEK